MRSAAVKAWISLCLGLALAVLVAVGPSLAQDLYTQRQLPGRTGGGVNPILLILPAIAVAIFLGERANATTPTTSAPIEVIEAPIAPPSPLGVHRIRTPKPPAGASNEGRNLAPNHSTPKRVARTRQPPASIQPLPVGAASPPPTATGQPTAPPPSATGQPAAAPPPAAVQPQPAFTGRALPPPPGETRFRAGEVLVAVAPATPSATIARILRIHRLEEADAANISLLETSIRLWRIPGRRSVASVVRELAGEPSLTRIQPNYLYELQQEPAGAAAPPATIPATPEPTPPPSAPEQYALVKLHVDAAEDMVQGEPVRVAVIDTAVDAAHPDLDGAIEAQFDAIGGAGSPRSLDHGTSIAGAIAARGRLKGVAPSARILSARAFDSEGGKSLGSTTSILKAIDWAWTQHARIVNMSFAGPPDPMLHDILAAAFGKGMVLVAAAGNAGPKSPPLYPGADEKVLAVTATDADDKLYPKANVGHYIAVAAPGVDVLLPAPRAGYALETGTSVSAALVSGVAALLLERNLAMPPAEIRRLLTTTATPLGTKAEADEFGAGLVDAQRALLSLGAPPTN